MGRKNARAAKQAAPAENKEQSFPTTEQLIEQGFTTKSARIRELDRLGMKTGDIARQETNGLYQHAYNVLHRPLKRPAEKVEAEAPVSEASEGEPSGDETDRSE